SDAILSRKEIIPGENFKTGDRIQAYLSEVVMTNRGPEIRLSRTSPMYLVKLFEVEVPEILDGNIEIKSAAREPGQRAKIAVFTADRDIDPVGACVGMKGSRVQNVVNELQGEKIDIVRWNSDVEVFARAALAPSEISNIQVDHSNHSMDVVVEEDQLSLAIGRRGQNVRLAAMLTGYKINIISKSKLQEKIKKAVASLMQISSVSDARAQIMVQNGIMSIADLSAMDAETLAGIFGGNESDAAQVLKDTHTAIEQGTISLVDDEEELVSASAVPAYKGLLDKHKEGVPADGKDKFSEAERRLREELAAFKLK
ncbi:MAG: transcription termination factor NusA, partial [Bdellovibrionales bacterium]|nr:transcription termination factor NusA [Bdellovibrionales bacterium]